MPKLTIPQISMRNIQTTPYVAFRQGRMGGNPGQCDIAGPNPLIGWRKGIGCCPPHNTRWQEVIKNTCCVPPIKRIQNRGGVIDASYSYTTRGYLESSCQSYKDNAFNFIDNSGANTFPKTCNVNICPTRAMATYKRNNPQFKKQGAVSSRSRMNRLKYNTIVGTMPYTQQYFGGQTANKSIFKEKSKNCCFCSTGTLKNPCHGQNIPCSCPPH
jgi:hypothetical protein